MLRDSRVETEIRAGEADYDLKLINTSACHEDMPNYLEHPVHLEVSGYIKEVMETGASLGHES